MENRLHIKEGMERERDKRPARHRREENQGEQIMFPVAQGYPEAVILVEKGLQLKFKKYLRLKLWKSMN